MSTTEAERTGGPGGITYEEMQASPEFAALRQRFRSYVFPMTGVFLVWYFVFVLLATYAPAFMRTKVVGNITIGLIIGLLQFVSTFVITSAYARWASRNFDAEADRMRERIEGGHW